MKNLPCNVLIRPKKIHTKTITWMKIDGGSIFISFPEKDEDFKKIIRGFDFSWNSASESWLRSKCDSVNDLCAEIAHKLVDNGFCVVMPNPESQEMLLDSSYTPESRRWVKRIISGKYENWFSIGWKYEENMYDEARMITASKYKRPNIIVPPEHYEEVIGFAEEHGFDMSESAVELIDVAKTIFDNAMIPDLPEYVDKIHKSKGKKFDDPDLSISEELLDV